MSEPGQAPDGGAAPRPDSGERIQHGCTLAELVPIYFRNLALTLLTLGFYRFWARTEVRRLLWGHTSFLGDPLVYLGRPGELLIGFVVVLVIFVPPAFYLSIVIVPDPEGKIAGLPAVLSFAYLLMTFYLASVGAYTARRYRLSRTSWRGIRGAQSGSAWTYGLFVLLYGVISLVTFGWFYPWQRVKLARRRIGNTYLGDRRCTFDGRGIDLLPTFALMVIGGGIAGFALEQAFGNAGAVASPVIVWLLFLNFRSRELRYFATRTALGGTRFSYGFSYLQYLRYVVGNLLITIATLTTGWPFLQRRQFVFWQRHLAIEGTGEFASLRRSAEDGPKIGEGLAEMFDSGFDVGF